MANANTVGETVELLGNEDGVAHACEVVEAWAEARRWHDLVALGRALEARCEPSDSRRKPWFESVADHVEDQLALCPGDAAVDALLALSLEPRERSVSVARPQALRVRALASRLGYGQNERVFLDALERAGKRSEHHELFACWMHEVVLRGTSLSGDARAKTFRDEVLARATHPLAGLPLELRPSEREAPSYMPLYGDRGLNRAVEALTSGPMSAATVPPPADGSAVRAKRVDDPSTDCMTSAVRPWVEGTNGKVEAKVFELDPQVSPSSVGRWLLRALPLDATTRAARLDVARTGPEGVFGPLFSAASNGGAYSSGLGGAYGRLAAWTSLGALVGAPASAEVDAIEKLAAASAFLTFRAPGPWFHDVAWDLGVLALRPGGRTAAVLAATDTD